MSTWLFIQIYFYLTAYKIHGCIKRSPISAGQIKKKKRIKRDKIKIMNIICKNTFNLHF